MVTYHMTVFTQPKAGNYQQANLESTMHRSRGMEHALSVD